MASGLRVALLRGINVGGNRKVAMAELRALAGAIGFGDATTLLQSGNLVFSDPRDRAPAELEALLGEETRKAMGLDIDYVVRTPDEWDAAIARNPFAAMAADDPSHLLVMFLKGGQPTAEAIDRLNAQIVGPEVVALGERELFLTYPDGIGTSKLTNSIIEKALGKQRGTARNWNTVLKLRALLRP